MALCVSGTRLARIEIECRKPAVSCPVGTSHKFGVNSIYHAHAMWVLSWKGIFQIHFSTPFRRKLEFITA